MRRRVLFVGGKGGVGKTSIASTVGLLAARAGRRTLVVSTDPAHNLGHLWQRRIGDRTVDLMDRLQGTEIDPAGTTDQHLRAVGATVRALMPEHLSGEVDRYLDSVRDSPGVHEAAVLERIAEVIEGAGATHDLVVVDTAPTGHTLRLMTLPETMTVWTDGLLRRQHRSERFGAVLDSLGGTQPENTVLGSTRGTARERRDQRIRQILTRRRTRFEQLRAAITDPGHTAFVIVLTAERLPVLETIDFRRRLAQAGVHVAALVVNKRSPDDNGEFLRSRARAEQVHVDDVRARIPDVPLVTVPMMRHDITGTDGVAALAEVLAAASGPSGRRE